MSSWFNLERKLILLFIVLTTSTSGLCFYIIHSYNNQLSRYDALISSITRANNIHVQTRSVVETEFYHTLSNQKDTLVINSLHKKNQLIKKEFELLKSHAKYEDESVYVESLSRMIDSFIEKCILATKPDLSMKEKLKAYQNANSIFNLISKNMSEFISLQIKNRANVLSELKKATHWIRLIFLALTGCIFFFSILFGFFYTRKISTSIHNEMEYQKHQLIKTYTENLETTVQERTTELELKNKELEEFASAASHDLQEPLRKIIAFGNRLHNLESGAFNEQGVDYLNRIVKSANRMKELINGLLQFARLSTKKIDFKIVDLNKTVEDILTELELSIQEKGAQINVEKLPTIEAHPIQIRQMIQNFLTNAIKYQAENSTPIIHISSQTFAHKTEPKTKSYCELTISDNGIGISEEFQPKIFNMFERVHSRSLYQGTGVGLALCKKIIIQHNGSIKVESKENLGTTFIIKFPLFQEEKEKMQKPAFLSESQ